MTTNTTHDGIVDESPFHRGERAVQERIGVREKLETHGRNAIRDFMPDQHRTFFAQLPFVLVGCVDHYGQPWTSVLASAPGFIRSPDPQHLEIHARPLYADPLQDALAVNAPIGLLGIEPHTRRRNRMNGIVEELRPDGFSLKVLQSFGNCPKYIQARQAHFSDIDTVGKERVVHRALQLEEGMRHIIRTADTYYIATAFTDDDPDRSDSARSQGVDVSHRGGKPGFVRIDDERTMTAPEFVGNFFFNTTGNIVANPRAGLLFIDFQTGDLLYLTVTAEIIWDGDEVNAFEGAQRLFRFHIQHAIHVENSLPLRWGEAQLSPMLEKTGTWKDAAERAART